MSGPAAPARRDQTIGYLEVVAAAAMFGSAGIFSEELFAEGFPASSIAPLRLLIGALALTVAAALANPAAFRPGWRGTALMLGLGGLVTAVFQIAEQLSFAIAGVTTTVGLMYLAPALVVAASGPLLGEWPTRAQVALALLSVAGVWLTVTGGGGAVVSWSVAGTGWGVLCGVAYAAYTLFGRVASPRHGALATTLYSTLGGALLLLLALPLTGQTISLPATPRAWGLLVVYALTTQAAGTGLFYDALRRIETSRASITATLEPVVAAVLATILLDQGLRPHGWLGLALVVGGVAGAYAVGSREVAG